MYEPISYNDINLNCIECGKKLDNTNGYKETTTKKGKETTRYICDVCGARLLERNN